MIILYHAGGARDFQLLSPKIEQAELRKLLYNAKLLLNSRGYVGAAQTLSSIDFSLSDATNNFNDEFCVLHAEVPLEKYELIQEQYSTSGKEDFAQIADIFRELGAYIRFIVCDLKLSDTTVVRSPDPVITSEVLRQTLDDVEALIQARSPTSCVDRIHTALHSYLQAVCDTHGIAYEPDASITHLFKTLRNEHPALANLGPRTDDIEKILRAFASIMDALNPIRNRASAAHPNVELLGTDEAVLVINVTRTLLHYLDSKFSSK